MKKLWLRICSLVLVVVMTAQSLPLNVWAEQSQSSKATSTETSELTSISTEDLEDMSSKEAQELLSNSKVVDELTEERTEFTKKFLLDSGLTLAVVYDSAVHYEENGQWEEIDNTLKTNADGSLTNTAGVWDISFPQQISRNNQISITKDGYTMSFGMAGELRQQGNLEIMSQDEEELTVSAVNVSDAAQNSIAETEATVPETTEAETTVATETVAEDTTAPTEAVPETTAPEATVPEATEPEATEPATTAPIELAPELEAIAPTEQTTSVMVDGKAQTFAVSAAKTVNAQIKALDHKEALEATAHKETVLTKPVSQLMYANVYSNTDIQYDLRGKQLKESVILESYNSTLRGYQFSMNTGELVPVLEEDGAVNLYDKEENIVFHMPAPFLKDSKEEYSYDVKVLLSGKDGAYTLTYLLPQQWLASSERAWPVILDPVVAPNMDINNIQDRTILSKTTSSQTWGLGQIGYTANSGIGRFLLKYGELPQLGVADVIVSAMVALRRTTNSSDTVIIEVHKVNENWSSETVKWSNRPSWNTAVEDYARFGSTEGWSQWDITDIARSWYTVGNYGMIFTVPKSVEDAKETVYKQVYSSDYSTACSPTVYIAIRNSNGLENYWGFTSSSAGRAGTGYVNQNTGNLVWVHDDLGYGGNLMPVSIQHIYNANDREVTRNGLGNGWRTNYNQRIYTWSNDNSYKVWDDADGTKHYFQYSSSKGAYVDEDGLEMTLSTSGSGDSMYTLKDKYDNKSIFDSKGRLRKMINNQKIKSNITIEYTATTGHRISTITDGVGRKYTFTYNDENLLQRISYTGKPAAEGESSNPELSYLTYEYDANNNMIGISYQDGRTTEFGYAANHLLSSVKDIDDYTLTYTYSNTALNKPCRITGIKEEDGDADGGELSLTYEHNSTLIAEIEEDGSVGNTQILQFNNLGNVIAIQDDEGHAQYAQYAKNTTEESGKGNQLKVSSKLQNTVGNRLMDTSFDGDTIWGTPFASSGYLAIASEGYLGNKSLSMNANDGMVCVSTPVTIEAGETYTFSAYLKTSAGTAGIGFYDSAQQEDPIVEKVILTGINDWTRLETSYTNTENSDVTVCAAFYGESGAIAKMDCVQLEKAPTASRYNLVQNGDFSYNGSPVEGWTTKNFTSTEIRTITDDIAAPQLDNNIVEMIGAPAKSKKLMQTIDISGGEGDTYVISGWAKADSIPLEAYDTKNREFGVRLTFNNEDDTTTPFIARFNPYGNNTEDWQYTATVAVAEKEYTSILVEVIYAYNCNTAHFDGIQVFKESFGNSYTYDDDGNVTSVVDLQNQKTQYEYDENNMTKQILPGNVTLIYDYDDWRNVKTATTETGLKYVFDYDDYGNTTSVSISATEDSGMDEDMVFTRTINVQTTYTDDHNLVKETIDDMGNKTTYHYDPETSELESVDYPETGGVSYTYDTMGRMTQAISEIDSNRNLTADYGYTDDLLTSITTGNGTAYSFTYGAFDLRTSFKIGNQTKATYHYTDRDNYLSSIDYANGDKVEYEYDDHGRLTQQTYEDNETVTYGYDNDGALAKVTDSATGRTTKYYYDFTDRLMKYAQTGEDFEHSVAYSYDNRNNLSGLTENLNGKTYEFGYTYDDDNRITEVTAGPVQNREGNSDPAITKTYSYDLWGRLSGASIALKNNKRLSNGYSYFTDESVTSTQLQSHRINIGNRNYDFLYTYDERGNITQITQNNRVVASYVYDSADQLIRENNRDENFTYVWTYDNAGNILERKEYPYTTGELGTLRSTVSYAYEDSDWGDLLTAYDGNTVYSDSLGNPLNIGTWSFEWQHGRQLRKISGMGEEGYVSTEFTYDADGIRTKKEVTNYSLQDVGDRTGLYLCSDGELRYFTNGQPTYMGLFKDENDDYYYIGSSLKAVRGQEYWVTATNGLISGGSYTFANDGKIVFDKTYGDDGALFSGLRTDMDGETRFYENGLPTYAGLIQVNGAYYYITSDKIAVKNCSYPITKTNDLLPEGTYTFDADGKMIQTNAVMARTANGDYQVWVPDETVVYEYVYNGSSLSQLTVDNSQLNFFYDASGVPMAVLFDDDTTDSTEGTIYYYITNIQGDVIEIIDSTDSALVEYYYDAWGNDVYRCVDEESTAAVALNELNPLRYRGYVYDQEYEFYYLQSRYYDPELGRFLNADAFTTTGQGILGNNMFAYCCNNPVNMNDAGGNLPKWLSGALDVVSGVLQMVVGAAVGATVGWSGVGAVAAGILITNGAATATKGVGKIVNSIARKSTLREDNIIKTGVQSIGGTFGGSKGKAIAGGIYDGVIAGASLYAGAVAAAQEINRNMPQILESKLFTQNDGYGVKIGNHLEMFYRNPNAAGGLGGTIFSYKGPLGKLRLDWDPMHHFHFHPPGHK